MEKLILDNFFTANLTSSILNTTDDGTFVIDTIPNGDWGWVIVNYGKSNQEIIPYYDNNNGTLSFRGIERNNPLSHSIGETVYINNVAQIFNYMNEQVGNNFKYRKVEALLIELAGAIVNINGTRITFTDTNHIITDNSTNYIYIDYRDNTAKVTTTLSDTAFGYALYEIVASGGAITTITKNNELYLGMLGCDNSTIVKGDDGKVKVGTISTSQVNGLDLYISDNVDVSANSDNRHNHTNKALLDTYDQTNVDIADAISKEHTHANKALLDTYTQTDTDIADAISKEHTHANKTVLDGITQAELDKIHSHTNKIVLDGIEQTDIDNWNTPSNWGSITGTLANQTDLQNALNDKVDDSQVLTNVPSGAVFTDTTYTVGDGELSEINFTSADNTKLDGIEAGAKADQDLSHLALKSDKGIANGYASLDANGTVPASELPSYVDDILEYASLGDFPATGESGKIYIALDTDKTYRWSGSAYVHMTSATALWGEIEGTLSNQTDLQNALDGKVDDNQVLTNVPAGALFTDTNTTEASGISVTTGTFNKNLTALEDTVQKALEKLDDLDIAGTALPNYTVTNGVIDRTFDANNLTVHELADVLHSLITDVQSGLANLGAYWGDAISGDTGVGLSFNTTGTDVTSLGFDSGFVNDTAPTGADKYIIIDIGGVPYKIKATAI